MFFDWSDGAPEALANRLQASNGDGLVLQMISNRGAKVWPEAVVEGLMVDHWRARFTGADVSPVTHAQIANLLNRIAQSGLDFIKTENLCLFDGTPGYSLALGE